MSSPDEVGGPAAIRELADTQPAAAAALAVALRSGPSHAYLFQGPPGSGKREAARRFAAELLADAVNVSDAPEARRRAMIDPSPHPDLIRLAPDGLQYRVEAVRERVIRGAANRPYEGRRRVFVIESAEALREESQNALLKTLEEPPSHAHLILLANRPEGVLDTIRSRCTPVAFGPLPIGAIEAELGSLDAESDPAKLRAVARLSRGNLDRAHLLGSPLGESIRRAVEQFIPTEGPDGSEVVTGGGDLHPWSKLLEAGERAASEAESGIQAKLDSEVEMGEKRPKSEAEQLVKRESRRASTEILDLGLDLLASWYRDLEVLEIGAEDVVDNVDRIDVLSAQARTLPPASARQAIPLINAARNSLHLNVSANLALEALHIRLSSLGLRGVDRVDQ